MSALQALRPLVRSATEHIVVGKDVLELLSSAMYVEPLTIYREYLQNAADAIDAARSAGLLGAAEPGRVDITLDSQVGARTVRLRDNGTGISGEVFLRRLLSFGASDKRGTNARGFRGVGRLSGLGFAQELVFRSRAAGEGIISELRWDCRKLRAALRRSKDDGLESLVLEITTASRRPAGTDDPDHFFEVELIGVDRHGGAKLLNAQGIENYIGQVAPVPFAPEFSHGAEIREALHGRVALADLEIFVNGEGPLYRPHRDRLVLDDNRSVAFETPTIVEVEGVDGEIAAIAWFLHHDYEGALPNAALVKGIRLRSGNIQVGEHTLLEGLFTEPRFNAWSVGEVQVLDTRLVPNGRRDNFEQNVHLTNLLNQLTPTIRDIARRCRTNSARRKWTREFELQLEAVTERLLILEQGSLPKASRSEHVLAAQNALERMDRLVGPRMLELDAANDFHAHIDVMRSRLRSAVVGDLPPNPLQRLPKATQEFYGEVFKLIYEVASNRAAAKMLIDRMVARLVPER